MALRGGASHPKLSGLPLANRPSRVFVLGVLRSAGQRPAGAVQAHKQVLFADLQGLADVAAAALVQYPHLEHAAQ